MWQGLQTRIASCVCRAGSGCRLRRARLLACKELPCLLFCWERKCVRTAAACVWRLQTNHHGCALICRGLGRRIAAVVRCVRKQKQHCAAVRTLRSCTHQCAPCTEPPHAEHKLFYTVVIKRFRNYSRLLFFLKSCPVKQPLRFARRHPEVLPLAQRALPAHQPAHREHQCASSGQPVPGHERHHPQLHARQRPRHAADRAGHDCQGLCVPGEAVRDRAATAAALHGCRWCAPRPRAAGQLCRLR